MTMRGKDRAALRAEAHHLRALVHVGQQGITAAVRQALDEALSTRELVKVQFVRGAPIDAKEGAGDLSLTLGAEVVQVIGRTMTLYRHNPELGKDDQ